MHHLRLKHPPKRSLLFTIYVVINAARAQESNLLFVCVLCAHNSRTCLLIYIIFNSVDVSECMEGPSGLNANCTNTIGLFMCEYKTLDVKKCFRDEQHVGSFNRMHEDCLAHNCQYIYDIFIQCLLDFVWPWIRLTFCEPINNRSFLL
jgi:hypothetical protein